jgi:hypothetical protein
MESEWISQWKSMTVDELIALREQMQEILSARLKMKKSDLDRRLQILDRQSSNVAAAKPCRP